MAATGDIGLGERFVGRATELRGLEDELAAAIEERSCRLVVLAGEPGVGKSRLARELRRAMPADGCALRGRCLPYADAIAFWPFAEALRARLHLRTDDAPADVHARLRALVGAEPDGAFLLGALAGLLGVAERVHDEDLALALRRLLEVLAAGGPVLLELDDLQWAGDPLLDLVEGLPGALDGAPVLVLGAGRPELLQRRPGLPAVHLAPLAAEQADALVEALLPGGDPGRRARIAEAAGGNPLFAEELVAAGHEEGPAGLDALLQARLDRLPPDERALLERAAVVGEAFDLTALEALGVPDGAAALARLADRRLVVRTADGGARFRHMLLRDAAYARLGGRQRGALHERFAAWVDARGGGRRADLDPIAAHHLERAAVCRPDDEALRARAADRLADAGRHALAHGDAPAAITLLQRALALDGGTSPSLRAELGGALYEDARFDEASEELARALADASRAGDERGRLRAAVAHGFVRVDAGPDPRCDSLALEGEAAAARLQALGDLTGASRAWALVAIAHHYRGRQAARLAALERSIAVAGQAGEAVARQLVPLASALLAGPTPLPEARARVAALLEQASGSPTLQAGLTEFLGAMATTAGDREEGLALLDLARERYRALGLALGEFYVGASGGGAALWSGDPEAALALLRGAGEVLERHGERSRRSTVVALSACAHALLGEHGRALAAAAMADELGTPDDTFTQIAARAGAAWARAGAGDHAGGLREGEAAMAAARATDSPLWTGVAELARAEALAASGRHPAAAALARTARARFAAKGAPWLRDRAAALTTG